MVVLIVICSRKYVSIQKRAVEACHRFGRSQVGQGLRGTLILVMLIHVVKTKELFKLLQQWPLVEDFMMFILDNADQVACSDIA